VSDDEALEMVPAIDEALGEALADCGGGIVEAWLCFVQYVDAEGNSRFTMLVPEGQRLVATAGCVGMINRAHEHDVALSFSEQLGGDCDDD
jgi:hypothetical protein